MFPVSTLPPAGNGEQVPEQDMVPVKFAAYDETGRLTSIYTEARFFYHRRLAQGQPLVLGEAGFLTHYVEFVGGARAPVLRVRPELTDSFDRTEIAVGEPVTLAGLPPAVVTFDGPLKGRHEHPGGDLVVGWTVPGTYTLTIEAFPFVLTSFTVTVGATS